MNLLCDPARPPLILSFGRSGSMLLTHDIGKINLCDPITAHAKSADFFQHHSPTSAVQSHQLFTSQDLARRTCFFSLRRNPIDTILSTVLAHHYRVFHVWSGQSVDLDCFEYENWPMISSLCRYYCQWHTHYGDLLLPEHRVIYYEDYVQQAENNAVYSRTFPCKKNLLKNFQQVHDYIAIFLNAMLNSQRVFDRL